MYIFYYTFSTISCNYFISSWDTTDTTTSLNKNHARSQTKPVSLFLSESDGARLGFSADIILPKDGKLAPVAYLDLDACSCYTCMILIMNLYSGIGIKLSSRGNREKGKGDDDMKFEMV